MKKKKYLLASLLILGLYSVALSAPLKIHPTNSRYLTNDSGKAIYITGSHTWWNIQNETPRDAAYFSEFLDFLQSNRHNFTRLWVGLSYLGKAPYPWERTGLGNAHDNQPKFDMTLMNQSYFNTIRERVLQIQNRGMYCSVMFFGSHIRMKQNFKQTAWHPDNNINPELSNAFTNKGDSFFTTDPAAKNIQKILIAKFIDTLNDVDNIIWEIMNEGGDTSGSWQVEMADYIRTYEASKPKQHLIGITGGDNMGPFMFSTPADWISPDNACPDYWDGVHSSCEGDSDGGPASYNDKMIILDTDHLWCFTEQAEIEKIRKWAYKAFCRGNNPIYMDNYDETGTINTWENPARIALGRTLTYANKVSDLAKMIPSEDATHCSTTYCLMNTEDGEYIAYQPEAGGNIRIHLLAGDYQIETLDTIDGSVSSFSINNWQGGNRTFNKPDHVSADWLIFVKGESTPPDDVIP